MSTRIFPKGTPTEFYGYNAPVIHIDVDVESMGTVEVDEDEYTPYEKFLVSIGQGQRVRYNRMVGR